MVIYLNWPRPFDPLNIADLILTLFCKSVLKYTTIHISYFMMLPILTKRFHSAPSPLFSMFVPHLNLIRCKKKKSFGLIV